MPNLNPTELLAWRGFLYTHDTIWKALDSELAADQLNLPAYELLLTVQEAGPAGIRMAELAQALRFSGGGLTRLVDRLQAQGFTERRRCTTDGRGFEVLLTERGKRLLRRIQAKHIRAVRHYFLDRLTTEEVAALAAIWVKFQ